MATPSLQTLADTGAPEPYTYDHLPQLRELLKNGGLPGVEYLQVAVHNLRLAQREGWTRVSGHQMVYTIVGPNGSCDCELFGSGEPISGQDPEGGARVCWIDMDVRQETGFHDTISDEVENLGEMPPIAGEGTMVLQEPVLPKQLTETEQHLGVHVDPSLPVGAGLEESD